MSSNTIAPVCKSCQKGRSSNQRKVQRPQYVEENYYSKYHNRQAYSDSPKIVSLYPVEQTKTNKRRSDDSNVSNDHKQRVCMNCGKH